MRPMKTPKKRNPFALLARMKRRQVIEDKRSRKEEQRIEKELHRVKRRKH